MSTGDPGSPLYACFPPLCNEVRYFCACEKYALLLGHFGKIRAESYALPLGDLPGHLLDFCAGSAQRVRTKQKVQRWRGGIDRLKIGLCTQVRHALLRGKQEFGRQRKFPAPPQGREAEKTGMIQSRSI